MRRPLPPKQTINSETHEFFIDPLKDLLPNVPEFISRGDRPLQMSFEDQLNALIYFHLQEHTSARHLVQDLNDNDFARACIAPDGGISRSSLSEILNARGLEPLQFVYRELYKKARKALPKEYAELGTLISVYGTLIDAVLSMYWADYRKGSRKAKGHFGFNINQGIPARVFLTDGKGGERPFVSLILSPGQTGVMDRGYQCHAAFDILQHEGKRFVCRIKVSTTKNVIKENPVNPESFVFYDAEVLPGTPGVNQTERTVRVAGYEVEGVKYYVATDRRDLTAEQVATVYKLRWRIETFFKWWKKHLNVYHLIARSEYGLMVQIPGGLITYLLMAIYCRRQFDENVSIRRIRELRTVILNELYGSRHQSESAEKNFKKLNWSHAKT
ncbi:MAG: IS4 family transposase [Okeania sp. SIO3C4]|nr:IS4 family transposase [Okeania sp. SIO3C4]